MVQEDRAQGRPTRAIALRPARPGEGDEPDHLPVPLTSPSTRAPSRASVAPDSWERRGKDTCSHT